MKQYEYITGQISSFKGLMFSYIRKINWVYAYIAFIHWYISFFTDRFIFRHENISDGRLLAYKGMFLIILFIVWQLTAYAVKEYKHSQNIRNFIKYSLIYFTVMMVFLLLTWPGVWRGDELAIMENFKCFLINRWHGPAISYFYIFSMMIFPFPSGVAIVQNIIISMIVGYIILEFRKYFKNSRLAYLMYVPFLLFPTIDSNLYLMSSTLYGYLYLLVAVKLFLIDCKDKITTLNTVFVTAIVLVMLFLRREAVVFLILMVPLFVYCYKMQKNKKTVFIIALLSIITINTLITLKDPLKEKYEITNIYAHYYRCLKDTGEGKQLYSLFDKLIDVKIFNEKNEIIIKNFSKQDYSNFTKQCVLSILKSYKIFWQDRLFELKDTAVHGCTEFVFDKVPEYSGQEFRDLIEMNSFQPISKSLRRNIISFIEIEHSPVFVKIFYNKVFPVCIMFFFIILSVVLRQKVLFSIYFILFLQTFAVFLTVPVSAFMYYFYLYLCCYVSLTVLLIVIIRKINIKNDKIKKIKIH